MQKSLRCCFMGDYFQRIGKIEHPHISVVQSGTVVSGNRACSIFIIFNLPSLVFHGRERIVLCFLLKPSLKSTFFPWQPQTPRGMSSVKLSSCPRSCHHTAIMRVIKVQNIRSECFQLQNITVLAHCHQPALKLFPFSLTSKRITGCLFFFFFLVSEWVSEHVLPIGLHWG